MTSIPHLLDADLDVTEIVRRELRGEATEDEMVILKSNPDIWRSELITIKLSCEGQMVASKARRFQNHHRWITKKISTHQYLEAVAEEKTWKCNVGRLLQQIETKIQQVKNHE